MKIVVAAPTRMGGQKDMTQDEVLALSVEELRIKAAESTGFKWILAPHGGCRFLWNGSPGTFDDIVKQANGTEMICEDACRFVPDYPHDIAAAGELW